jgi:protein subunit release factor A
MTRAPQPPPIQFSTDREILEREVIIETFRRGGPGGQHRNVTDSAVRLRHTPSGICVTAADSRSQHRNRDIAFARLIERIRHVNRQRKARIPTRIPTSAVERRLREKKQRQVAKHGRTRVADPNDLDA